MSKSNQEKKTVAKKEQATVDAPKGGASPSWEGGGQPSKGVERNQLLTLFVLSLSLAIIVLDATIVIVALPTIQSNFGISFKDLEWITSLYALVFGSFLLTWGKLGDQFGRRRIFMAGVVLFIVGSIIDGVSTDLTQMLVGRIIQGFGAAMASPATLAILTTTFTGKARNVAFGIWGATAGAAAVLGPLLGGYFTSSSFTWRWAFFINIPIGIVALIGALIAIKESRFKDPKYTTDYGGLVLITVGLTSLLFGLIEGQSYGWITPSQDLTIGSFTWAQSNPVSLPAVSLLVGFILLAAFTYFDIHRSRKGRVPLFDFGLLRFPGFRYGLFTVFIVAMGEFGAVFIFSIYFQSVRGLSALTTGETFLPMALSVFFFAPIAGALSNRIGPKWIITTGMTLEAIALYTIFAITSATIPIYDFYPVLVVYGAGVGFAISQVTSVVLMSIPWQKAGIGSGANNTVRQVGSAFGIAVIGAVLVAIISAVGQADVASHASVLGPQLVQKLDAFLSTGLTGGASQIPAGITDPNVINTIQFVYGDAITQGTKWAAFTAAIFVSFGALSSLLIPDPRAKARAAAKTGPEVQTVAPIAGGARIVIIAELLAIIGLLTAISWDYQQNTFMQEWFTSNASALGFLLGNYIGPITITVVGAILILWKMVPRRLRNPVGKVPG